MQLFSVLIVSSVVAVAAFAPNQAKTNINAVITSTRTGRTQLFNDLWGEPPNKDGQSKEMSKSLPFIARPKLLDGSLPGDVGFDPFGFAGADKASLLYMREAEVKHGRLAMLAVVGWPIAELFDKAIAEALGLPIALTKNGNSPSVLNGGLEKIDILYWVAVVTLAAIVEIESSKVQETKGKDYLSGDVGFDPLGLFPKTKEGKFEMMTKEVKHGRLAMMALLGFIVQEALYRTPVVAETPQFFTPQFL